MAAVAIVESLLGLFSHSDRDTDTDTKSNNTSACGDILYPSTKLSNRILQYRDDDCKENTLRSTSSDFCVKLTFINNTNTTLHLFWITYDGDMRVPATSLKAQARHSTNSFVSHPFIISLSDDRRDFKRIIGIYIARSRTHTLHDITIEHDETQNTFAIGCEAGKPDKSKKWTRESYEKSVIVGFTIYFEHGLVDKYGALLHLLRHDLGVINRCVPCAALRILHSTAIWLNDNYLYYDYPHTTKNGTSIVKVS